MLILLLTALSLVALMMLIVLHSSVLLTLLSLILSLGGIALWIFKKKLPYAAVVAGSIVCMIASAAVLIPAGNGASSISGYTSVLEEAEKALREGKNEQAQLLVNQVEETYGVDDTTVYLTVTRMIAQRDYDGAYEKVEQMSDRTSRLYYTMKEQIYRADASKEAEDGLSALYLDAAQNHPDWTKVQQNAGICQIQQKNYESAIYFLERTLLQDTKDPITYYYLGMANYYMSQYEVAMNCFEKALEYGLGDEYKSDLLWYVGQIEQEE